MKPSNAGNPTGILNPGAVETKFQLNAVEGNTTFYMAASQPRLVITQISLACPQEGETYANQR